MQDVVFEEMYSSINYSFNLIWSCHSWSQWHDRLGYNFRSVGAKFKSKARSSLVSFQEMKLTSNSTLDFIDHNNTRSRALQHAKISHRAISSTFRRVFDTTTFPAVAERFLDARVWHSLCCIQLSGRYWGTRSSKQWYIVTKSWYMLLLLR